MIESDPSAIRRLTELEASVADLRRQLDARIARPPVMGFPRDRWLGVTVANGQTYPATGNTFYVKLISAAFSPETPGDSTVTQRDRGTIVLARTRPAAYLAEGTEVFADRLKGVGTGGSWWIQSSDVVANPYAHLYGGGDITDPWGSLGYDLPSSGAFSYELLANGTTLGGAPAFPDGTAMGSAATALGTRMQVVTSGLYAVSAQANLYLSTLLPDGYGSPTVSFAAWLDVETDATETRRGAVTTSLSSQTGERWWTPQVVGVVRVTAPEVVRWMLGGTRDYSQYTAWRVVNWECVLTRLAD